MGVSLNTYIKQKGIVYREMVSKRTEQGDGRERLQLKTPKQRRIKKKRAPVHNAHVAIRYS